MKWWFTLEKVLIMTIACVKVEKHMWSHRNSSTEEKCIKGTSTLGDSLKIFYKMKTH